MAGGARLRSGPPADPDSIRSVTGRNGGDWVVLPKEGRSGPPPPWPLAPDATEREQTLWERHWALPHAVMWERQSQIEQVAMYVRVFGEAEQPGAVAAVHTLRRQLADSLGVTLPAMKSLHWRVAEDSEPPNYLPGDKEAPVGARRTSTPRTRHRSAKARFGQVTPIRDGT